MVEEVVGKSTYDDLWRGTSVLARSALCLTGKQKLRHARQDPAVALRIGSQIGQTAEWTSRRRSVRACVTNCAGSRFLRLSVKKELVLGRGLCTATAGHMDDRLEVFNQPEPAQAQRWNMGIREAIVSFTRAFAGFLSPDIPAEGQPAACWRCGFRH